MGSIDTSGLREQANALREMAKTQPSDSPGIELYLEQADQLEALADQLESAVSNTAAGTPPSPNAGETPPGATLGDFGSLAPAAVNLPGELALPEAPPPPSQWRLDWQLNDFDAEEFAKLNHESHLSVSLHKRKDDGTWEIFGALPPGTAEGNITRSGEYWLEAGEYEARLYWDGDPQGGMRIILARETFTIAGDDSGPAVRMARGWGMGVAKGDADIAFTEEGPVYPHTKRRFTITGKKDFSQLDLHFVIRPRDGFTYQCTEMTWLPMAHDPVLKLYGTFIDSEKDIAAHLIESAVSEARRAGVPDSEINKLMSSAAGNNAMETRLIAIRELEFAAVEKLGYDVVMPDYADTVLELMTRAEIGPLSQTDLNRLKQLIEEAADQGKDLFQELERQGTFSFHRYNKDGSFNPGEGFELLGGPDDIATLRRFAEQNDLSPDLTSTQVTSNTSASQPQVNSVEDIRALPKPQRNNVFAAMVEARNVARNLGEGVLDASEQAALRLSRQASGETSGLPGWAQGIGRDTYNRLRHLSRRADVHKLGLDSPGELKQIANDPFALEVLEGQPFNTMADLQKTIA